ncbi:MAG TPA: hypothetical protein PLA65_01420 [Spirochaetota bacterium]|nr:hypothetical protein [Spirochaetota bacterium]HOD16549.1 hypothetical protein [Spirochaetota bacterium]HPG51316.1 hypothetical protein [Spirochaetota bacterium]HPN10693.1 hypothetical protein [Spirochaetota bacterium]
MSAMTEQFSRVLEKYSLSRPLSPDEQRYILKRRKAGLRKILRQKGGYSALLLAILGVQLLFKKFGLSISLLQAKILAGVTAVAVSAGSITGAYTAARYVKIKIDEAARRAEIPAAVETRPAPVEVKRPAPALTTENAIRNHYNRLEQVDLDDGTRLVGAVIYQDSSTVRIHTIHGIINLPVTGIRSIRIR